MSQLGLSLLWAKEAGHSGGSSIVTIDHHSQSEAERETIELFTEMLSPLVERLNTMIDDLPAYEAPEVLPNGDILIRRKDRSDPYPPPLNEDAPKGGART